MTPPKLYNPLSAKGLARLGSTCASWVLTSAKLQPTSLKATRKMIKPTAIIMTPWKKVVHATDLKPPVLTTSTEIMERATMTKRLSSPNRVENSATAPLYCATISRM